eukprot:2014630-Ditylum_brightwellii.AAC.1
MNPKCTRPMGMRHSKQTNKHLIKDVQCINAIAMVEEGPRPVLAWEILSKEAVAEWREKVCKQDDGEN